MPKKKSLQVEEPADVKAEVKEEAKADLREALDNIVTEEGIIGYILKGPTSATVDLKDPSSIIDYAVFSSAAFESSDSLSHLFALGKIHRVVLEGKDIKVLCMTVDDQRLSVFMEKNVDHNSINKKLTQS